MPRLPREELRPGMLVTATVKSRDGQILVAAGTRVDDRVLRVLRVWGIAAVAVDEDPSGPGSRVSPALDLRAITIDVHRRFLHQDLGLPLVHALLREAVARRMRRERRARGR